MSFSAHFSIGSRDANCPMLSHIGAPGGGKLPGMKCYYPTDDSVYFDCDATTPGKLRVCHCD